jgi:hypothetical protein
MAVWQHESRSCVDGQRACAFAVDFEVTLPRGRTMDALYFGNFLALGRSSLEILIRGPVK